MASNKKLLTLDDLYDFCVKNNFSTFKSMENNGEGLYIQVYNGSIKSFEEDNKGLLPVAIRSCHIDLNRNNSFIKREVMEDAKTSFYNRPILGNVIKLNNGEYDFRSHDMEIIDDPFNNGEKRVNYIERPIGVIPESANLSIEYNEEYDKYYLMVDKAYVYEDYGNLAADILRTKDEFRVSVEICVEELSYNAEEKYMSIDKFFFNGVTILGRTENGTVIQEGMEGSRITLDSFSKENNSLVYQNDEENELIKTIKNLTNSIKELLDSNPKGGKDKMNIEELLIKYNIELKDIDFDYSEMNMEELDIKLNELFGETSGEKEPQLENFVKTYSKDGLEIKFEISHEDVRASLYQLLYAYEEMDDDWYYISKVYDEHFVYENWNGTKIFDQRYAVNDSNVSFDGDRSELFRELLTASEKAAVEQLRNEYSLNSYEEIRDSYIEVKTELDSTTDSYNSIIDEYENLKSYHDKNEYEISRNEKMSILNAEEFECLKDIDEFKELIKNMDSYSKEELEEKSNAIYGKYSRMNNFNYNPPKREPKKVGFSLKDPKQETKKSSYGKIFDK